MYMDVTKSDDSPNVNKSDDSPIVVNVDEKPKSAIPSRNTKYNGSLASSQNRSYPPDNNLLKIPSRYNT